MVSSDWRAQKQMISITLQKKVNDAIHFKQITAKSGIEKKPGLHFRTYVRNYKIAVFSFF